MNNFNNYLDHSKKIYYRYLWWGWQIILILAFAFFMIAGIKILQYAYRLNDPFNFIIVFFASNLIILVSVVLMIGFAYRLIGVYRLMKETGGDGKTS